MKYRPINFYEITPQGKWRFSHKWQYKVTVFAQSFLAMLGIAAHNERSNECVSDFGCCVPQLGRYWLRLPKKTTMPSQASVKSR